MSTADLLDEIRSELPLRTLSRFNHADARRLGEAAAAIAERDGLAVAVRVTRGLQCVYHLAFAGTTAEHDDWVRRKINTALLHEVPSLEFVLRQELSGQPPSWLDPLEYAVAGGAVPVVVDGSVVGAIAVSGLVGSVREDHDLAVAALRSARAQVEGLIA
ncbi:heme-binding protein [Rathayibacter sp. VKM Ac-2927]|uniref:heme-binding protein n=1 Tax=Rathayibacter sp. VKM Ac-2927 TaxID=2929478 RepID=UPI001FB4142B|nr:heme-binding protein [Rathayibacter sp. VKM Ac-2927]MCJ1688360.1 heme-binding protein [Rathayibacter sp. VKM Ac-2927]